MLVYILSSHWHPDGANTSIRQGNSWPLGSLPARTLSIRRPAHIQTRPVTSVLIKVITYLLLIPEWLPGMTAAFNSCSLFSWQGCLYLSPHRSIPQQVPMCSKVSSTGMRGFCLAIKTYLKAQSKWLQKQARRWQHWNSWDMPSKHPGWHRLGFSPHLCV